MSSKSLHPGKHIVWPEQLMVEYTMHGSARDSVLCPVLEIYNRNMWAGFLN